MRSISHRQMPISLSSKLLRARSLGALPATATPRRDGIEQAAQGVAFRTEGVANAIGPCKRLTSLPPVRPCSS
jgi:hypothetical protein